MVLNRREFIIATVLTVACGAELPRLWRHRSALEAAKPLGGGLVLVDGWVLREHEARTVFA